VTDSISAVRGRLEAAKRDRRNLRDEIRSQGRVAEPIESQVLASKDADIRTAKRLLREIQPAKRSKSAARARDAGPYAPGSRDSYFRDLIARTASTPVPGVPPHQAEARLRANTAIVRRENHVRPELAERRLAKAGVQLRSVATSDEVLFRDLSQSAGSGLEFDAPTWMVNAFYDVARSEAPLFSQARRLPLPNGTAGGPGYRVSVPGFTSKTAAQASPATQNTVLNADDIETSFLYSYVTLVVSGQWVAYQALDQGNVDQWLAQSNSEALSAEVETLLWDGGGDAAAEPTGVVPAAGNSVFATDPTSTTSVLGDIGGACYEVGVARKKMPESIFVDPGTLSWLLQTVDGSTNEPSQRPGQPVPDNGAVTTLGGVSVFADGSLPTTGSGATAPNIVACRPSDLLVLASTPVHEVMPQAGGAALSAFVRSRVWVASILRYGSSAAYVNGLQAP
jgi:hypothetical protein